MNQPEQRSGPPDFWPAGSEKWYPAACRFLDYPRYPLEEYFRTVIRPDDTVLDCGCGFGLTSIYLATLAKEVWALDPSEKALSWLEEETGRQQIKNIRTVCDVFPSAKAPDPDVMVTLYVAGLMRRVENVRDLLAHTKREGLFLAPHAIPDTGFADDICRRLNMERKHFSCRNGCYMVGALETLGAKVECHLIRHDFGQPVDDIDDAADFLLWQLHLAPEYRAQILCMAKDYLTEKDGRLYLENIRSGCLIHYIK